MEYTIVNENIVKGDWMLVNNPQSSIIKNVIRKCNDVRNIDGVDHYSFFIITDEVSGNGHNSGYYPISMCKKVYL